MSRRFLITALISSLVIILLVALVDVFGLIAYGLIVLSAWFTIGVLIVWLLVRLLHRVGFLARTFRLTQTLKTPLLIFLMGLAGVLSANLIAPPALLASPASPAEQLAYMAKTDQSDRLAFRLLQLNARDQQRLKQVLIYDISAQIETPEQQYQAALIYQHGSAPEHFERAYELAQQAYTDGLERADGLWQAAYDRWQIALGKPQVYGTQSTATFSIFGIHLEQQ